MSDKGFFTRLKDRYQAWAASIVDLTKDQDESVYGAGWNRLGYHRPMAGYFYTFGLLIPQVIMGLLLLPLIQYTELRSPNITAYEGMAGAIFGSLYSILDLELGPSVDRFVPQYAISDQRKAMQYVTFFIKYQMWSGLVQIAFVGVFMFMYIVPYTNFTYLAWFILFINIKQYPAILGTFQSVIKSFQHLDKEKMIVFYRASVIEPLTKLGGGIIGLYWGMANPVWGETMGFALGYSIGGYVDDFFTFTLGMYWLSKILDKYNIRMWEIYGQSVPSDVWRSALSYSMRLMPQTIFGAVMGFFSFLISFNSLPGYTTYSGLIGQANNLKKFVTWSDDILNESQPSFSESFNNGKPNLTKYYIAEGLKYNYFFFMILGGLNLFGLPIILDIAMGIWFSEEWELIVVIAPVLILTQTLHAPFEDIASKMIYISGHPEIMSIWNICATIVNLGMQYYFLFVLKLGWLGLVTYGLPMAYLGVCVKWYYMQKKIIHFGWSFWKDIGWQCFVAPVGGGAVFIVFMVAVLKGLWPIISPPFTGNWLLFPLIVILLILCVGLFVIYIPLVSWLGFWDDKSIQTFRRAVNLSGPSLWLIWPMYKLFVIFYKKSPFKKQSYVKMGDIAEKELKELMELRYVKFVEYMKNNPNENNQNNTP